ncbi:polysaccharide pyruvyl transferase family protein [Planococcus sp. ISL-110]|uniref:polysaccharide pyruvyl transferase family protein n=1 Tax=Planococcus sp. ISL-110 TaxID=2819167 RepID=UPI001BE67136|nr:polysaccharide pyruvyl transferase family protein [Planococcus sp. ISL-110]MBT2572026.1 polysaccharide pyruvyl transferase family protein [Planococcus sp. ISL-110]
MKTGTLTFHNVTNYGAMLQAYALQKYIHKLGIENEIIDFYPNTTKQVVNRSIFKKASYYMLRLPELVIKRKKIEKFNDFKNGFLSISSEKFYGDDDINNGIINYEAYVVGSDQIWNTQITNNSQTFYLNFVDNKRKIAYAGSFGKTELSLEEKENIGNYLTSFDSLSVRESEHQKILEEVYNITTNHVLDPVFLLNKQEWISIAAPIKLPSKYILVYVLENSAILHAHAKEMSKKLDAEILYISMIPEKIKGKVITGIGPREFLYAFENATYVCTNSFHGTAFAIIFNKQFSVVRHTRRNSRIESLLQLAELSHRYVDSTTDKVEIINYGDVLENINIHIKSSKKFLENALEESTVSEK